MRQLKTVYSNARDAINIKMMNFIPTSWTSKIAKAMIMMLMVAFLAPTQVHAAAFISEAIDILDIVIIAIGGGFGIWGVVNLLKGYGNDNPGANGQSP